MPDLSPGAYTIWANAQDSNGHITTTAPIRFVVNMAGAVKPTVAITAPSSGAAFIAPDPIALAVTASAAGGATISSVAYFAGANQVATAAASPFTASWTDATAGAFSLMAMATDSAGARAFSAPVAVTVTSPPPPTVAMTSPANSASYWSTDGIPLGATASGNGGATISKVEFYSGGTLLGAVGASPYTFSWTTAGVGTHALTAKAFDNRNVTSTSATVSINVTLPPVPTIVITLPANGAVFSSPASIPISVNAAAASGASIDHVDFYNGTTLIGTAGSAPWRFTWTNVAQGSYSLTAKVTDSRGATATSTAVVVTVNLGQVTVAADAGING